MTQGLLPGVRVLELGEQITAPYCGKILALMGAEVIKVEPPEGDAARRMGPFPDDKPHPEQSGLFLALNANKYGIVLDLRQPEDVQQFRQLAQSVDIVIENLAPGRMDDLGLGYQTLRAGNPGIILTSITPFGRWGPYKNFKATDLVLFHMSGQAHGLLGPVEEPDAEPPIRAGGHQAEFVAGMAAATATMMALYRKHMTGEGRHINISAFEAMTTQLISGLANCAFDKPAPPRDLRALQEAATGGGVAAIGGVLPCKDGYVAISPREDTQWERWVELMDNPVWATEERFLTREGRERNFPALWERVGQWTQHYSKHEIARWGQERRIPCFPVNTVRDLFNDAHLKDRQFFTDMTHPVAGKLQYPGVPYRFANTPLPVAARPAPLLGEHNDRILRHRPNL